MANILHGLAEAFREVADMLLAKERVKVIEKPSWDGSASQFANTTAYCAACLIDVNAAAGRDEKSQSHCMLPMRGPEDPAGSMVDKAVYAAAGGRGISQVKRPDDVPQVEWDAAVKAAANKLIAAYTAMEKDAPDGIYKAAGKEPPTRENMISIQNVFEQVDAKIQELDEMMFIHDVFVENGGIVALGSSHGRLYRIPILVSGTDVQIGAASEVELEMMPARSRGQFIVSRQADGRVRWYAIACSAILNRAGELDSRALFDSFVEAVSANGYPELRFYHQPALRLGGTDYLARDGYLLLASGLLDEEQANPLAAAFVDAMEHGRGAWGTSDGFMPTSEPEQMRVAEDVTIPVYTTGVLREISVLPEGDAAAWLTAIQTQEVLRMQERVKKALEVLFGSADKAAAFVESVDERNRAIESDPGIVARESPAEGVQAETPATPPATEPVADEEDKKPEEEEKPVEAAPETPELDEMVLQSIADRAAAKVKVPEPDTKAMEAFAAKFDELNAALTGLEKRLKALESTDEDKREKWQNDLPARRATEMHRPRVEQAAKEGEKPALADIAASTLAQMPARR